MNELKNYQSDKKLMKNFPTEIVLVLDGNIGQNSVKQAEVFKEICDIDSVIITKLDGTARGVFSFQLLNYLIFLLVLLKMENKKKT